MKSINFDFFLPSNKLFFSLSLSDIIKAWLSLPLTLIACNCAENGLMSSLASVCSVLTKGAVVVCDVK